MCRELIDFSLGSTIRGAGGTTGLGFRGLGVYLVFSL